MTEHLVVIGKFLSCTPARWEAITYHQSNNPLDMALPSALADRLLAHNLHSVVPVADIGQIQRSIHFLGSSDGNRAGRVIDLWVEVVPEL